LQRVFRRDVVRLRIAGQERQVLLLAGDHARIGNPCLHHLTLRHRICVHGERLGNPHPVRRHEAHAGVRGSGQHLGMVPMQVHIRPLAERFVRVGAQRAGFGAEAEQVGRGAIEIAPLAVDRHAFHEALRVEGIELHPGEAGDLATDPLDRVGPRQAEIQPDAPHALALELQRTAQLLRQRSIGQRGLDVGFGLRETTGFHLRHHLHQGRSTVLGSRPRRSIGCGRSGRAGRQRQEHAQRGGERRRPATHAASALSVGLALESCLHPTHPCSHLSLAAPGVTALQPATS